MRPTRSMLALAPVVLLLAACSSNAGASSPPTSAVAGTTAAPAGSSAALAIGTATKSGIGTYLTGQGGRTLYIFKHDTPGTSNCTGQCAATWPPLEVAAGQTPTAGPGVSGTLGTLTRSDGKTQVTYDQMPLYYYGGDSAAGDTNGQGIGGIWFAATVSGSGGAASPAASPSASSGYGY